MNDEIKTIATELISVKRQIKALLLKEKALKDEIKPLVKEHGQIKLETGKVYYGESKGGSRFSRVEVLEYIRDSYGDALADQIDEECTKVGEPRETVYIQLADL
ncbi:hypothetical protein [uncultured Psychromonas sp.]|uniref:hypothetical protein n=1 Tax=uncultured Psychromonas sp. TaxID=173974 RepID=UPI002626BEBE|nr:hypothetical protein [uncultured Psychromonas sp.]